MNTFESRASRFDKEPNRLLRNENSKNLKRLKILTVIYKQLKKQLRNLRNYKVYSTERQRNGKYEREVKRHRG